MLQSKQPIPATNPKPEDLDGFIKLLCALPERPKRDVATLSADDPLLLHSILLGPDSRGVTALRKLISYQHMTDSARQFLLEKYAEAVTPKGFETILQATRQKILEEVEFGWMRNEGESLNVRSSIDPLYFAQCKFVRPQLAGPQESKAAITDGATPLLASDLTDIKALRGSIAIRVPGTQVNPARFGNAAAADSDQDFTNICGRPQEMPLRVEYGVSWSRSKIVRDLMQNFYDGQGATLSGVSIEVSRADLKSPYKVTIKGDAEFNYRLIVEIGGTTKRHQAYAAGFFGEGTKIVPLLLLRDNIVQKFSYSSRNWAVDYFLAPNALDQIKLYYNLRLVKDQPGNAVTLETKDVAFVKQLLDSVGMFRYESHPDFQQATYENQTGGFKYLGPGRKGNVYINGQRFEVVDPLEASDSDTWSGRYPEFNAWSAIRPANLNRDRLALESDEVTKEVIGPVLKSMKDQELVDVLFLLKAHWRQRPKGESDKNPVIVPLLLEIRSRNIRSHFPEDCIAVREKSPDSTLTAIEAEDRVPCRPILAELGMNQRHKEEWIEKFKPSIATREEQFRLEILKVAASLIYDAILANALKDKGNPLLGDVDLNAPLRVFEDDIDAPRACYSGGQIWWNRKRLMDGCFVSAIATQLHELTHEYGGDDTRIFTLMLADWITAILHAGQDRNLVLKLAALEPLWSCFGLIPPKNAGENGRIAPYKMISQILTFRNYNSSFVGGRVCFDPS